LHDLGKALFASARPPHLAVQVLAGLGSVRVRVLRAPLERLDRIGLVLFAHLAPELGRVLAQDVSRERTEVVLDLLGGTLLRRLA